MQKARGAEEFIKKCNEILDTTWRTVTEPGFKSSLSNNVCRAIEECVNSKTRTYRYVLPTQIVAKLANGSLDCRCVQVKRGGPGAFDARSVCQKVVVKFDRNNFNVLGGSSEPYVSKPLRVQEIAGRYRDQQKNIKDWDNLCSILNRVEKKQSSKFTMEIFKRTLFEIFERLSQVRITYPVPRRISYKQAIDLIGGFVATPSGGDRPLAIASALLEIIGKKFNLFTEVRRSKITAPDIIDVECLDSKGLKLMVEVKDRELTLNDIKGKLQGLPPNLSDVLFLVKGISKGDESKIGEFIKKEFSKGLNIHITDLFSFVFGFLILLGETGRRDFLINVGNMLDKYESKIQHRRAWSELLSEI